MSQGDGIKVKQIVWDRGLEEEPESAGVTTSATFPPRTLESNQAHGAPNTAPLPAIQNRRDLEGLFQSGDPSLAPLPLPAFWSQSKDPPAAESPPGDSPQNSFEIPHQVVISNPFAFSPFSLWPQPWEVLSQLLRAGLHGAEEIRVCLVSISKGFGPQP